MEQNPENKSPFFPPMGEQIIETFSKAEKSYDAIYGVEGQNGLKRKVKELEDELHKIKIRIATYAGGAVAISALLPYLLKALGIG